MPYDHRKKKLDPAQSPRAMYCSELRFKREQAGLSQDALGARLFVSGAYIGLMETGVRRMQAEFAPKLDEILETDGFFVRNLEAARKSPYREHFAPVAELEAFALTIREWEPLLVPGLLQTPDYAMAVFRRYDPVAPAEVIQERLDARMTRARIFDNPEAPLYWAMVDEAAIRRPVGGTTVMAAQLRHVAGLIRRNRIIVQVVPFRAGAHAAMEGALKLLTFENDAPIAYSSAVESGTLLDDPATVQRCSLTYDLLRAAALSPDDSQALIEAAAEEYEHAHRERHDGGGVA